MSNSVFPSNLPGLNIDVERHVEYPVTVHSVQSGKEVRVSWQDTPVIRYTVSFTVLRDDVNAPAPNQAYTELALVEAFYAAHRGEWDSWLYDDPHDGAQRRVRFDGPLTYERVADGLWVVRRLSFKTVL